MKNVFRFSALLAIVFLTLNVSAQRYMHEIFTDVTVTKDVKYAENFEFVTGGPVLKDLTMDVYQPVGDNMNARPVIIFLHAGSFLPKCVALPFGVKEDSLSVEMCTQFAKRGWVAISATYRIGWNPTGGTQDIRAGTIINAVYRAMQDAKSCIRFLRMPANASTYKIDTNKIAIGGNNAGGYVSLAVACLNDTAEILLDKFKDGPGDPYINQAITGGFDGEGGDPAFNVYNNPGYSSDVQLVLNMGGAIGDVSWIDAGEPPIVNFHEIDNPLTPYETAVVIVSATGDPVVEVSGSKDLGAQSIAVGNQDTLINAGFNDPLTTLANNRSGLAGGVFPFPGMQNSFEPWAWYERGSCQTDITTPGATGYGSAANPFTCPAKALRYIDTIMRYFSPRAVVALGLDTTTGTKQDVTIPTEPCEPWTGIFEHESDNVDLGIYPNPAASEVKVQLKDPSKALKGISMLNVTGKEVVSEVASDPHYHVVKRNGLEPGVYLLHVTLASGEIVNRQVVFE